MSQEVVTGTIYKGNVGRVEFRDSDLDEAWSSVEVGHAEGQYRDHTIREAVIYTAPGIEIMDTRPLASTDKLLTSEAHVTVIQIGGNLCVHIAPSLSMHAEQMVLTVGLRRSEEEVDKGLYRSVVEEESRLSAFVQLSLAS